LEWISLDVRYPPTAIRLIGNKLSGNNPWTAFAKNATCKAHGNPTVIYKYEIGNTEYLDVLGWELIFQILFSKIR
jgi:hypothetical protein